MLTERDLELMQDLSDQAFYARKIVAADDMAKIAEANDISFSDVHTTLPVVRFNVNLLGLIVRMSVWMEDDTTWAASLNFGESWFVGKTNDYKADLVVIVTMACEKILKAQMDADPEL
jgi:hypothetical protein